MSRMRYITYLMLIVGGFLVIQNRIGQSQPPLRANLEERIAWINQTSHYQIVVAMLMLGSILLLAIAYHISKRRLANRSTGP